MMEIVSVYQLVNVSMHTQPQYYLLFIYYELVSMSII